MQAEVRGGDLEKAIYFFRKAVGKEGIHAQIRRRLAFVKPSDRRRAKAAVAAKRKKKRVKRWEEVEG